MIYLFAAYFVLWSITLGYLFVLGGRQRRLEQQLASLSDARAGPAEAAREGAE